MKKFVVASFMALACIGLVYTPTLRAQSTQDSDQIALSGPEYNAYQQATTQTDPKAKAAALESFLQTYPQSKVKGTILDQLIDAYQGSGDADKTLSAASRQLQVDPNNMKAIFISVYIKKGQGAKTGDAQTLDDAAALARKGLVTPKPASVADADWKKTTDAAYPLFHSAIAVDDIVSKKDAKTGIDEYRQELMLYPADATKSGPGLVDTLQLAEAYAKLTPPDAVNAVWFYARALSFAPDSYKPVIEKKLDYWYKKFHGAMDGLDDIKAQTAANLFAPGGEPVIKPAKTPAEFAHDAVSGDLNTLNLSDREFVLANGVKEDVDKLWATMKDKATPVPGVVIEATATVIKVAVSDDAKEAKIADFIVNLKAPLADKEIPAVGTVLGLESKGAEELDGTYDSYTQIPATATTAQTAQIVLREGSVQAKKPAAPAHKPAAGHKAH
jgi:hypothetical protein